MRYSRTVDMFTAPPLTSTFVPRPYQSDARTAVHREHETVRSTLVVLPTGCHRAGQLVLMADGSLRVVESVAVGDSLMGPDGTPRRVMSLTRASGEMAEVRPVKGERWVVDMDHVLTLVRTASGSKYPSDMGGALVDVTVREWLEWPKWRKHIHKLLRVGVDFAPRAAPAIDPYALGVCIGDGCLTNGVLITTPDREIWDALRPTAEEFGLRFVESEPDGKCPSFRLSCVRGEGNPLLAEIGRLGLRVTSESKFIPDDYRLGSRAVRLGMLAGLIDTDGHHVCGGYDYISKSQRLSDDVAFVARSLGLAAYVTEKICHDQNGTGGLYYRVSISGDCSIVPCLVPRKVAAPRRQKKDPLRTGLSIVPTYTVEPFFGFTLDGDQRYLLGDFTVTHNCGKTGLAGMLGIDAREAGGRILFLSPTITLCDQTYEALRQMGLSVGIEQADRHVAWPLPDVTVASVATMRGKRLEQIPRDAFALIVVDEAHRAPGGKAYRDILAHFEHAKIVGLTATPDRTDGVALLNTFETTAYEMTLLEAIRAGWLAPLEVRTAKTNWDVRAIKEKAGEVDPLSVAAELVRSGLLHDAATTLAELGGQRKMLAFLPTVNTAKAFCAELLAQGLVAAHVDGETPPLERQRTFASFRSGETRVLTNCMVLTEGFDMPDVSVVALLSPTKSRSRLTQMIGRGTRNAPGKESCLILDFCPGRMTKGRLASPADALAGRMLPDDVYAQLADEGNLEKVVADAELTAEQLRRAREEREERAAAKKLRLQELRKLARKRRVEWETEQHDTASVFGGDGPAETTGRTTGAAGVPETDEQRRARLRLCTVKQAKVLRSKGLNPDMPYVLARIAMDAIASNGWAVPDHIKNDRRFWPKRPQRDSSAQGVAE